MKKFFLIISIVLIITLDVFEIIGQIQILGLVYDILGVYFFATSIMSKTLADIVCDAYGDNDRPYLGTLRDNLAVGLYQQRIEARSGFVFLTIGFLLQGIGTIFPNYSILYHLGSISLLVLLLATIVYHRKQFVYSEIIKKIKKEEDNIYNEIVFGDK